MNHIDYKLLYAFSEVIKQQSFEKAADVLCLTQSAVSQRIKQLEQMVAQPVLIRSNPIVLTEMGKKLLGHYNQVQQLETDILTQIFPEHTNTPLKVSLATNADSLATWLVAALAPVLNSYSIELNLALANELNTIQKLKNGEVFGAISTEKKAQPGCVVTKLGQMNYVVVASSSFKKKYFSKGINKESLLLAPGILFDNTDDMHTQFIKEEFGLMPSSYPCHTVQSSEAFVNFAKQGLAYGLIAELQIKDELTNGSLINLLPQHELIRTLYWHRWVLVKGVFKKISEAIIESGIKALN